MNSLEQTFNGYSRRNFLGICGKMSSISMLSSILQLKMTNSMLAAVNPQRIKDYRALVCVFLGGGNDSFNMLAPWRYDEIKDYKAIRNHLALEKDKDMSPIYFKDPVIGHRYFGVHKSMSGVRDLYNSKDLAFIANIGTLVRPTSMDDFKKKRHLPRGLFSHLEQQQSWQTSVPEALRQKGWVGRMSEMINDAANKSNKVSMNISLSGSNLLQAGSINALAISGGGPNKLDIYHSSKNVKKAVDATLAENYKSVLHNHYNYVRKDTIEQNYQYHEATKEAKLKTKFPGTKIGGALRQVALGIASRDKLDVKRQTFFVGMGGFDHHFNLIEGHAKLLAELDAALVAFNKAMKELKVNDNVTLYTGSDFGRSLAPNSDGADHGWGGNQIVMGGAVKGGTIYGEYPRSLALKSATDTGRGRQLPTTSVDELHATLAHWYGVPNDGDMQYILPNIRNFWKSGKGPNPLKIFGY